MHPKVKSSFLQACINHSSLSFERINDILVPLCESYEEEMPADPKELKNFVTEINNDLKEYNQALTFVKHPLMGEEFLVFSFTFETHALKHNPFYSDADRNYFARLLETMVTQDEYGISWVLIYSVDSSVPVTSSQKTLTKGRIQELVHRWTSQGYFLEKDDMLYLGPRMIVEFATYLRKHFADYIQDCPLCSKLVLWDVKCADCNTKIHRDCIRKYLTKNSNCPTCKKRWNTRLTLTQ